MHVRGTSCCVHALLAFSPPISIAGTSRSSTLTPLWSPQDLSLDFHLPEPNQIPSRSAAGIRPARRLYLEAVARHAVLVLGDQTLAVLLRIVGPREQHALVALRFLVFAYAAWL